MLAVPLAVVVPAGVMLVGDFVLALLCLVALAFAPLSGVWWIASVSALYGA